MTWGSPQPLSLWPSPSWWDLSPVTFSPAQELPRKGLSSVTQERQAIESPRRWTLTQDQLPTCWCWGLSAEPQPRERLCNKRASGWMVAVL